MKRPEILAPCGNMSALRAAVAAGADACYLAGNSFGARAYANNFSDEELLDAIEYAHLHGVKIYLTINTLVKNDEMIHLYDMLCPLYEKGLDAVIVQDYGIFVMLRKCFPDLDIHTSTQMNITTVSGANLVKGLGATRVVAAREMTLEELRIIREEADIEVEAFVHGAMCLCYSGRCLMSSMAGGRSGNRGRCAQPCRQRYNGSYKLSMRDMCTLRHIPALIDTGIDSFKIEGRMKNEYYVASTVMAYKELRDDYLKGTFSDEKATMLEMRLRDVFNRGGFTDGYLFKNRYDDSWDNYLIDDSMPGRRGVKVGEISTVKDGRIHFTALLDMGVGDELLVDFDEPISLTVNADIKKGRDASLACPNTKKLKKGTAVYRTRNKKILSEIDELLENPPKIKLRGQFEINEGKPMKLFVESLDDGVKVEVEGQIAQKALSRPLENYTIREKITQLGNTDYEMEELLIHNDNKSFTPVGDLKSLRRAALERYKEVIISEYERSSVYCQEDRDFLLGLGKNVTGSASEKHPGKVHVMVSDRKQLDAALGFEMNIDYLYVDMGLGKLKGDEIKNISHKKDEQRIILALPYINRNEYDIASERFISLINSYDGLYVRNIDDLAKVAGSLKRLDISTIVLAGSLYAYNDMAVGFIAELLTGFSGEIIYETPVELSKKDINGIDYCYNSKSRVAEPYYGKLPLMVTAGLRDTTGQLKDDKQSSFYVINAGDLCYNVLLSSKALSLHMYESEISEKIYGFTIESADEMKAVLSGRIDKISDGFTRGHYEKGI